MSRATFGTELTPRERACAMLHAAGARPELTADILGITVSSVREYVKRAIQKLGAYGGRIQLEKALHEWYARVPCSMCHRTGIYPYNVRDDDGIIQQKWGTCAACYGTGWEPA